MGILVNIEAIDLAGKTTQVKMVAEALEARGLSVGRMSFPDTPSRSKEPSPAHFATGVLIERYLGEKLTLIDRRDAIFRIAELRELSEEAQDLILANIAEKLVQILFSVNRRERADALAETIANHDVTLVGRYLSARTYGVANGVSRLQVAALEDELPQPDVTFLLDLDPEQAKARRTEEVRDRYEADLELQARIRRLYNELVREDAEDAEATRRKPNFVRLDATEPVAVLTRQITGEILRRLAAAQRAAERAAGR